MLGNAATSRIRATRNMYRIYVMWHRSIPGISHAWIHRPQAISRYQLQCSPNTKSFFAFSLLHPYPCLSKVIQSWSQAPEEDWARRAYWFYSDQESTVVHLRRFSYSLLFASRGANVVVNDFNAAAAQKVVDEIVAGWSIASNARMPKC